VTFEGLTGAEETGVKTEDRHDLLLHVQSRLAPVGGADLVQPVLNINVFIFGMKIEAQRLGCEVGEDEKWNVQFHISQLNS